MPLQVPAWPPPPPPPPPPPEEVTVTFIAFEDELPGFGFVTATEKVPAEDAVPLAVSWVDDTNVVAIEVPANFTCAPLTNWLPFSVMENEPLAKVDGVTLFSAGTGFCKVTVLEDFAVESAALTAARVTVFGLGTLAGALYNPDALIVPVLELPPVTPFTFHVTPVFELPLTVAVNCWEPPARTFADAGATDTLTPPGFVPVPPGAVPPHRPSRQATSNTMRRGMRLRMDSPGADHPADVPLQYGDRAALQQLT